MTDEHLPTTLVPETAQTSAPNPSPNLSWMKKTVLLVDVHAHTRERRAKIMRALGVTVHCADSAADGRARLGATPYNLVLVDLGADVQGAEALVQEIRTNNPRQLVAFLIGRPLFVASSLSDKRAQPTRVFPPKAAAVPAPPANAPAVANFDFGQKVKDAEAEQIP